LAEAFLHFKWQLNKKVFLLNCVAFFAFLLMLTSMTMLEGKSFFSNKAYMYYEFLNYDSFLQQT
jgi:hypothetical protein